MKTISGKRWQDGQQTYCEECYPYVSFDRGQTVQHIEEGFCLSCREPFSTKVVNNEEVVAQLDSILESIERFQLELLVIGDLFDELERQVKEL